MGMTVGPEDQTSPDSKLEGLIRECLSPLSLVKASCLLLSVLFVGISVFSACHVMDVVDISEENKSVFDLEISSFLKVLCVSKSAFCL